MFIKRLIMFQVSKEQAFLELFLQKQCYLRALRILLREIVRCVRLDIDLTMLCCCLVTGKLRENSRS